MDILSRLVRVGTVMSLDMEQRRARVKFNDMNISSGWLYVLANPPAIPDYNTTQQTEETAGGSGDASFESHCHELKIKPWMPNINDTVICLYVPVFNGDGFILGGIYSG